jgi:hypothetical protein
MQSPGATGAANESIDPSTRKERGPQDDKDRFGDLVGRRVAKPLDSLASKTQSRPRRLEQRTRVRPGRQPDLTNPLG